MILNLCTPLFRSGMLSSIKESIPNQPDINWIIVLCSHREILIKECNDLNLPYLTIDAEDNLPSVSLKINKALRNLKEGFFYGLDDDTTMHPNLYEVFTKYKNDYKMIVGQQLLNDGSIRIAQKPAHCYTDGAQALIHTSLLKNAGLGDFSRNPVADCDFLLDAWNQEQGNLILHEVISNYNKLR